MSVAALVLFAVSMALVCAVIACREVPLMGAVLAYAATLAWLIVDRIDLLPAAIAVALVVGAIALFRAVRREVSEGASCDKG